MKAYKTLTRTSERVSQRAVSEVFGDRLVRRGTLLMSFKLSIGRVATLGIDALHNEAIVSIYPGSEVEQKYLEYFLSQVDWTDYQDRAIKGNTLNREKIDRIAIALPSLPEQRRIATILWKVQRAIEVQQQLVATVRELKQAAMRQLFTRGLRGEAQKETDYGPLPESWETSPLGSCATVQTGVTKGRAISPEDALEVPYLRVANVQDGHLDLREMKRITIRRAELDGYLLRDGDVVLTEGGDFDKLGRGFIWRGEVAICVHQNHVFAVRADRTILLPEFLAYLAQSPYGRAYFLSVAHKTTNLACINSTKLKALPVPLPALPEQHEIATALQTIDRKLAHHERKRDTLQELFKTLLHELMTGRIRVHGLDIDITALAGGPTGGDDS
jgi:type I restriction enzyme S subunit